MSKVGDENKPLFGEVFEAVRRVTEARGAGTPGESLVTYEEAGVEFSRTVLNEYEVRFDGRLVFRARHTGALSSSHVFESGPWVEEVRRIDGDIREGGRN